MQSSSASSYPGWIRRARSASEYRPVRRLAILPLDERPCNFRWPQLLGSVAGVEVAVPPSELMGRKKSPGETEGLSRWLLEEARQADGFVVAAETLVYGGLVPSRVHSVGTDEVDRRLEVLRELRRQRPDVPLFVQGVILRLPSYDSDEEEPDYWAEHGARLHRYSVVIDALDRGQAAWEQARNSALRGTLPEALADLRFEELPAIRQELEAEVPVDVRKDFIDRREEHHRLNRALIDLVTEEVIDFLALTQDDTSFLGFPGKEQQALRELIVRRGVLRKVLVYPGADEGGSVLMARCLLQARGLRPRIGVRFSSAVGPQVVPRYEDRPLLEGIKAQISALGARWQDTGSEVDIWLYVNSPDWVQYEAPQQHLPGAAIGAGRSLPAFLESLAEVIEEIQEREAVALADVAYANGSDNELISALPAYVHPLQLAAYAGWNTSSNTIGTALAHATLRWVGQRSLSGKAREAADRAHRAFLVLRYAEDWAYQAAVRQDLLAGSVARLAISPYRLGEHQSALASEALRLIQERMDDWALTWPVADTVTRAGQPTTGMPATTGTASASQKGVKPGDRLALASGGMQLARLGFPWHRLFEVELTVLSGDQGTERLSE